MGSLFGRRRGNGRGRDYWTWARAEEPGKNVMMYRPPVKGRRYVVTQIHASYKTAHTGLLTVQHDAHVVGDFYVHTADHIPCEFFIPSECGLTVSLQVPPEVCGAMTISGYLEDLPAG